MQKHPPRKYNTQGTPFLLILLLVAGFVFQQIFRTKLTPKLVQDSLPVESVRPKPSKAARAPPRPVASATADAANPAESGPVSDSETVFDSFYCRALGTAHRFYIPSAFLKPLLTDRVNQVIIPKKHSYCLSAPLDITLTFVDQDPAKHDPFSVPFAAEARVEAIRELAKPDPIQISAETVAGLGLDSFKSFQLGFIREYGNDAMLGPARLITLRLVTQKTSRAHNGAPALHPRAETVGASEVRELQGKGAVLVDARRGEYFSAATIPGALSVPVRAPAYLAARTLSTTDLLTWAIPLANLNSVDHAKPMVVFGSGPGSTAAYNLTTVLRSKGFKRLYFFRGGYEEWKNIPSETPREATGIEVLTLEELRSALSANPVLVDTRTLQTFQSASIAGARNLPYLERLGPDGEPILRSHPLDAASLEQTDGIYPIAPPQAGIGRLIFYGQNEYDWAAFKAATQALKRGHRNVGWYRDGYDAYEFAGRFTAKAAIQKTRISRPAPPPLIPRKK